MLTGITLIIGLLSGYFIYGLMACFIDFKENRILKIAVMGGLGIVSQTIIYSGDAFNVCAALTAMLLIVFLGARGTVSAKAAVVMMVFPLMMGMNYIECNNSYITGLIRLVMEREDAVRRRINIYYLLSVTGKVALWAGICYFFRARLTKVKLYMQKQNWRYIIIIGSCTLTSILSIIISPPSVYTGFGDFTREAPLMGWVVMTAAVVTNLGVISLLPLMIESVQMKQEEQKAGIREEYYHSLEEQQEKVRKLRHDMNNHFQMLQAYLQEGDGEKAKDYLKHMDISALQYGGRTFCREAALNAMLNNRYDKLCETGADVHFNLDIPEITGIETVDLCTIFSNSLDNAVEAVKKLKKAEDRRVTLRARYEKGYFSYQLANSKCNEIHRKNGSYLSDKGGKNHGYGIENIREIVEKYGGKLTIEYTDSEFMLFLYITET